MKTLALLFGSIGVINYLIPYLSGSLYENKKRFNSQFLSFCTKLKSLDDDGLTLALRPYILGISFSLMALGSLILNLWGEDDPDAKELMFTWFGVVCFWMFALIPSQEFLRRFKELMKSYISFAQWIIYGIIAIVVLVILLKTGLGQPPTKLEVQQAIIEIFTPLFLPLILLAISLVLLLVGLPFLTRKAFIYSVRRVINFILSKKTKDPIGAFLFIATIFFLLLGWTTYFIDKIN